jgi:hypothetical protein
LASATAAIRTKLFDSLASAAPAWQHSKQKHSSFSDYHLATSLFIGFCCYDKLPDMSKTTQEPATAKYHQEFLRVQLEFEDTDCTQIQNRILMDIQRDR